MYFPALENLVHLLTTLPGVGQRSALRIVFHLLRQDPHVAHQLSQAITDLRDRVRFCSECGGLSEGDLCPICSDPQRRDGVLCIVEEPQDIYAIEKTGEFHGRYHVLMGALSPLDGVGPEDLRIPELLQRLETGAFTELLVATNPTMEGDATARYLADLIKGRNLLITRISHGIPTGAAIEYAEKSALARSIRNRQELD